MSGSRLTSNVFAHLFEGEPSDGCSAFADIAVLCTARGSRAENQDRACAAMLPGDELRSATFVAAIFDGMGGMRNGGEAAALTASVFLSSLSSSSREGLADRLTAALEAANTAVWGHFRGAGGSTLTALAIDALGEARCVHVGDSRAYAWIQDAVQITADDTIAGLLAEQDPSFDGGLLQFVGERKDVTYQSYDLSDEAMTALILTSDGFHSLPWDKPQDMFKMDKPFLAHNAERWYLDDNATAVTIDVARARAAIGGFDMSEVHCGLLAPAPSCHSFTCSTGS